VKGKYLDIHKVTSNNYCCSLGVHIDLKNKYIAFHLLWYYIHIGRTSHARFKSKKDANAFYKFQEQKFKEIENKLKKYGVESNIT